MIRAYSFVSNFAASKSVKEGKGKRNISSSDRQFDGYPAIQTLHLSGSRNLPSRDLFHRQRKMPLNYCFISTYCVHPEFIGKKSVKEGEGKQAVFAK
jgi:hypothetical protein